MHKVISDIDHRLELAIKGQRHTDMWDYDEDNMSAPEGMSYNEWIDEAMHKASDYIKELEFRLEGLEK